MAGEEVGKCYASIAKVLTQTLGLLDAVICQERVAASSTDSSSVSKISFWEDVSSTH
jgi:hypothetical protein